jgi:hypothetical protein
VSGTQLGGAARAASGLMRVSVRAGARARARCDGCEAARARARGLLVGVGIVSGRVCSM